MIEKQIEGAKEISERDISRKNRSVPTRDMKEILARLVNEGIIGLRVKKPKRGPPKKFYVWCGNGKTDAESGDLP